MKTCRLRYHLAKGPNYMKWQLSNRETGEITYYDPETFGYTCEGVLKNSLRTATRIFEGENKTVCSWINIIDGHGVDTALFYSEKGTTVRISYNPRRKPYWTLYDHEEINIDGFRGMIIIMGRELYVYRSELNEFLMKQYELLES